MERDCIFIMFTNTDKEKKVDIVSFRKQNFVEKNRRRNLRRVWPKLCLSKMSNHFKFANLKIETFAIKTLSHF